MKRTLMKKTLAFFATAMICQTAGVAQILQPLPPEPPISLIDARGEDDDLPVSEANSAADAHSSEGEIKGIDKAFPIGDALKKPAGEDAEHSGTSVLHANDETEFYFDVIPAIVGYAELYLEVPFQSQVSISNEDTSRDYFVKQQGGHRAVLVPIRRSTPARIGVAISLPDARSTETGEPEHRVYVDMKPGDRRHVRVSRKEIEERIRTTHLLTVAAFAVNSSAECCEPSPAASDESPIIEPQVIGNEIPVDDLPFDDLPLPSDEEDRPLLELPTEDTGGEVDLDRE